MKRSTIILSLILILSNIGWVLFGAYTVIDCGITQTYQSASMESTLKMLDQSIVVANLNLVGKNLSEVKQLLPIDSYGLEPFEKEGCLYAGGLCLVVNSNQIIETIRTE
jgi:hypothetical protein